jgi:hypothetical protein
MSSRIFDNLLPGNFVLPGNVLHSTYIDRQEALYEPKREH